MPVSEQSFKKRAVEIIPMTYPSIAALVSSGNVIVSQLFLLLWNLQNLPFSYKFFLAPP